jgi:TRAP-type mannitol/chloroaromatic compound transport system substrate-binding protein
MNRKLTVVAAAALVAGLMIGWLARGPGQGSGKGGEATVSESPKEAVTLKMASAFSASLPVVGEGGIYFAELVGRLSGGALEIKYYDPGKLVPALEVFDSVSKGAVDAGYSAAGFWLGKVPAASIFSSIPFGPDSAEYISWMFYGGGLELYQELYGRHNMWVSACGLISPEASGWFREEIKSPDQLKGIKIRFYGIGGQVMQKLGASVQLFAPGDIYPALERGVIDATELAFPAIDEKLGFYKVAKHYYLPGWHQMATFTELMVNMDVWKRLSPQHQQILATACKELTIRNLAYSESIEGPVLDRMKANGVQVHYWSNQFLDAFRKATDEVLAEESAKDPDFKRVYESLKKFREGYREWQRLSRLPSGY